MDVRNVANDMVQPTNLIDKLGLGGEVLRLRKAGLTQSQIATQLNLDIKLINQWLVVHEQLPEAGRQAVSERSIFNIAGHLQTQFERLVVLLEELKHAGDVEHELKALGEFRQFMGFAGQIIEKLHLMQQNDRLKEVILDLLEEEVPGIKVRALRKLAENRDLFSILKPL